MSQQVNDLLVANSPGTSGTLTFPDPLKFSSLSTSTPQSGNILSSDNTGNVTQGAFAIAPKWEYYFHSGSGQIFQSGSYAPLQCNGGYKTINQGLNSWNTGSTGLWKPAQNNALYTIVVNAEIPYSQSTLQFNLCLSGTNPDRPTLLQQVYMQSYDMNARTTILPHNHLHIVFPVFVQDDLYVSGAQILTTCALQSVQVAVNSCSIHIREG